MEIGVPQIGPLCPDNIGDLCDTNPTVLDGHFHTPGVLKVAPVCITGGPFFDTDGDGWCDISEVGLGASPGNSASTPEALSVPTTCSDFADNDLDGLKDLDLDGLLPDLSDPGCQLPNHDIRWQGPGLTGAAAVCDPPLNSPTTAGYTVLLRNNGPLSTENVQFSIYIEPKLGYNLSGLASVTGVGGGAIVTNAAFINIDGDKDVEWLTMGTVSIGPGPIKVVPFQVTYQCGPGPAGPNTDEYLVLVDVCHADDIAPLGVQPLRGACAGSPSSDGGQDRVNVSNDATRSTVVDDQSR